MDASFVDHLRVIFPVFCIRLSRDALLSFLFSHTFFFLKTWLPARGRADCGGAKLDEKWERVPGFRRIFLGENSSEFVAQKARLREYFGVCQMYSRRLPQMYGVPYIHLVLVNVGSFSHIHICKLNIFLHKLQAISVLFYCKMCLIGVFGGFIQMIFYMYHRYLLSLLSFGTYGTSCTSGTIST